VFLLPFSEGILPKKEHTYINLSAKISYFLIVNISILVMTSVPCSDDTLQIVNEQEAYLQ
jgi:hypothetical protein